MISLIAAQARNRVIGTTGQLPWKKLGSDMDRFRELTVGHPVIMGRKTWESIPERFRPLPERTNIVLSREPGYTDAGCLVASTPEEALELAASAPGAEEIFVIGGAQIYEAFLSQADTVYLTVVDAEPQGDARFPELGTEWSGEFVGSFGADGRNDHAGSFVTYTRHA